MIILKVRKSQKVANISLEDIFSKNHRVGGRGSNPLLPAVLGLMELIFAGIKFRKFWSISRKIVPGKLLENCQFANFPKFSSHKNFEFLNHKLEFFEKELNNARMLTLAS